MESLGELFPLICPVIYPCHPSFLSTEYRVKARLRSHVHATRPPPQTLPRSREPVSVLCRVSSERTNHSPCCCRAPTQGYRSFGRAPRGGHDKGPRGRQGVRQPPFRVASAWNQNSAFRPLPSHVAKPRPPTGADQNAGGPPQPPPSAPSAAATVAAKLF